MKGTQKLTGRAMSMPGGLAAGAAVSLAVTLFSAALIANMVDTGRLPEEKIGYGIMVLLLAASFLGAVVANGRIKRQRLMVSMLSGGIFFLILLSITALFFGGQYSGVGVTAGLILAGSGAAALLGLRQGRGGKRPKTKLKYR